MSLEKNEEKIIRIKVQQIKNKKVTRIENIPDDSRAVVLSTLKKQMGCGGTEKKDGTLQLQGDKSFTSIVDTLKSLCDGYQVELNGKIIREL